MKKAAEPEPGARTCNQKMTAPRYSDHRKTSYDIFNGKASFFAKKLPKKQKREQKWKSFTTRCGAGRTMLPQFLEVEKVLKTIHSGGTEHPGRVFLYVDLRCNGTFTAGSVI